MNPREHEAREAWCRGRIPGEPATFAPGEPMRCVGPRELRHSREVVTCGCLLRGKPKPGTVTLVRMRKGWPPPKGVGGHDWSCHNCGSALEIFAILEATG